jgi:hypothetical protein
MKSYIEVVISCSSCAPEKSYHTTPLLIEELKDYYVYNCLITYTPFPYPKLCPYPKPPQQQTPVGTPKDPTNQIAAHNLRAPIRPRPAGSRANAKPKRE